VKIIDWILAILVVALGVVHCAVTPLIYRSFSMAPLWFFGTGLAMIFVGMLNVLRLKRPAAERTCFTSAASILHRRQRQRPFACRSLCSASTHWAQPRA
jgi:hypothetical protein